MADESHVTPKSSNCFNDLFQGSNFPWPYVDGDASTYDASGKSSCFCCFRFAGGVGDAGSYAGEGLSTAIHLLQDMSSQREPRLGRITNLNIVTTALALTFQTVKLNSNGYSLTLKSNGSSHDLNFFDHETKIV